MCSIKIFLIYKCRSSKGLKTSFRSRRRRLVIGLGYETMGVASWHIRTLVPTTFPLHLDGFVLIHTRICWASNLHGNSPLEHED